MKKVSYLVLMVMMLISCGKPYKYDRRYYLQITGLPIPYVVNIRESFDDGDGHMGVLFSLKPKQLEAFMNKAFKPTVGDHFWNENFPAIVGRLFFKNYKYPASPSSNLYYKYGDMGKTQKDLVMWLCIIDKKSNSVWITILYPGFADG